MPDSERLHHITLASLTSMDNSYQFRKNNLADSVNAALTDELGYLLICVDEKNNVVKTYGDRSKYLLQKKSALHISDLLPKPLAGAFFKAVKTALKSNERVAVRGINIKLNKTLRSVNMVIKPLATKSEDQKFLLVLFSDGHLPDPVLKESEMFEEKRYDDQYLSNLGKVPDESKNAAGATREKPGITSENVASLHAGLLADNKEMRRTNKEMGSINEELRSINADYQLKNKELTEINEDLNDYFRSNINAQLFVNAGLLLMKYSPGAVRHINIRDSDIGRPIGDISINIKLVTLTSDIKEVIAHGGVITREVGAINGKWYQMMTMPYIRQTDAKTDGAIISFFDITGLKLKQLDLDRTNKNIKNINADLDNFVHTASHDLLGPLANIQLSIDVINQLKLADDPQLHKFLDIINGSIKMFGELVREMARIGKIENEMSVMQPVDVHQLLDELELSINNRIHSTGTLIKRNLAVGQIYFSKKNLRSILYNLISNAIKFKSPDRDPEIKISTKKEQGYIVLTVKDNGTGIPGNEFENIFKMYGRLHKEVEGQGMGLYLIRKIVDASGGNVIVKSKLGKGSIFIIYFKSEKVPVQAIKGKKTFSMI